MTTYDDEYLRRKDKATPGGIAAAPGATAVPAAAPVNMSAKPVGPVTPAIDNNPMANAQQVGNQVTSASIAARGRLAGSLNPMSEDAELYRRLGHVLDPLSNKGSPMGRQLAAQPILAQLGLSQQQAVAPVQPIAQAALQGAQAMNASALSNQDARQRETQLGIAGEQQAGLEATRQAGESTRLDTSIAGQLDIAKVGKQAPGSYQRAADGTLSLLQGGSAQPVVGIDGKPFEAMDPTSVIPKATLFEEYNKRATAIQSAMGMTPEQKQQGMQQLQSDPNFAPLFAQQQGAAPGAPAQPPAAKAPGTAAEFIKAARASGSKMSDAELTAYYNAQYGAK